MTLRKIFGLDFADSCNFISTFMLSTNLPQLLKYTRQSVRITRFAKRLKRWSASNDSPLKLRNAVVLVFPTFTPHLLNWCLFDVK